MSDKHVLYRIIWPEFELQNEVMARKSLLPSHLIYLLTTFISKLIHFTSKMTSVYTKKRPRKRVEFEERVFD